MARTFTLQEKRMILKGFVEFKGKWITLDDRMGFLEEYRRKIYQGNVREGDRWITLDEKLKSTFSAPDVTEPLEDTRLIDGFKDSDHKEAVSTDSRAEPIEMIEPSEVETASDQIEIIPSAEASDISSTAEADTQSTDATEIISKEVLEPEKPEEPELPPKKPMEQATALDESKAVEEDIPKAKKKSRKPSRPKKPAKPEVPSGERPESFLDALTDSEDLEESLQDSSLIDSKELFLKGPLKDVNLEDSDEEESDDGK
jgi:hypothetical protein